MGPSPPIWPANSLRSRLLIALAWSPHQQIDSAPLTHLPAEMLADRFGGPLLTVEEGQQLKPRQPLYRVRLSLQQNPRTEQVRLAGFSIEGERASVLGRIQRSALGALMLQASF